MVRPRYAGDTPLALDQLEIDINATILREWQTASVQRMHELEAKRAELHMRRGILKRRMGRVEP